MQCWCNGMQVSSKDDTLADILLGKVNPSGKLNVSFRVAQVILLVFIIIS